MNVAVCGAIWMLIGAHVTLAPRTILQKMAIVKHIKDNVLPPCVMLAVRSGDESDDSDDDMH